jgi:hypothetical protein
MEFDHLPPNGLFGRFYDDVGFEVFGVGFRLVLRHVKATQRHIKSRQIDRLKPHTSYCEDYTLMNAKLWRVRLTERRLCIFVQKKYLIFIILLEFDSAAPFPTENKLFQQKFMHAPVQILFK